MMDPEAEKGRSTEGTVHRSKGTRLPHLRSIREGRYLTQEQLSKMSGVARTTVYRLERGKRGAIPYTAWRLAMALGVGPEELVYGRDRAWWY